ncbi:MAG: hypothetical protein A3A33_01595 [Candidatus Yanofskybacteria bacterium RIFCSPLOWO2_01_FULL_49_25]|uniref:MobA-like NTP transferase domain-containing protein n=1 Tax=Candidatus Yanofskybacteria bacterium RIFCSPLOWO2_01_FULL_49_25 TaxID=1802701 RepID=A0A1F8GZC2_9BACT|nr:MAG: hypothetical protein A3A33_01595 [Candidatus Yanofskybacteria bacterium RIFCSPLOWO2_01_FULL_49_25]
MGTRLEPYTKNLPKGMLPFREKSLLGWHIDTLQAGGIDDIVIIKGYRPETISFPGVRYYENTDFATTNMVHTLMCAEKELHGDVLVCYGDIIYELGTLETVLASTTDIGVTADTDYWDYWSARLDKPENDVESYVIGKNGALTELGVSPCSPESAKVRYVGLIKLSPTGVEILKKVYHSRFFDKKDYMTSMLQAIIDDGHRVDPIYIKRGWLEFDTVADYERVRAWDREGTLKRFINI